MRVGFISLGCAKNLVDTEVMLGHLAGAGCTFVDDPADADVLVVNTCGFIEAAREESIQAILDAAEHKKTGRVKRLVVAGCLVQRYARELHDDLPEVDAFVGLDELGAIVAKAGMESGPPSIALRSDLPMLSGAARPLTAAPVASRYLYDHATPRKLATPPWTAFVKIAEGCDHTCSFCAIPAFRGAFRSRSVDSVVAEAEALARGGVREVNLISQDTSDYGRDLGVRNALVSLLERLDAIDGLRWIRLLYLYPNTITTAFIETMAKLPRVVKYVDMPLQHADPDVLRRMRRGGSADLHLKLLARFRNAMPDASLRSTVIVGFPGETEAEFEALLAFVSAARFDHLGVFTYSHEEGTSAFGLADDVPEEVKEDRRARLLERQQRIAFDRNARLVGRVAEVLVEGAHPETDHLLVGRLSSQAPEVDGQVLINDGRVDPGTFARVEITDLAGYDVVGRILDAG